MGEHARELETGVRLSELRHAWSLDSIEQSVILRIAGNWHKSNPDYPGCAATPGNLTGLHRRLPVL